MANYERFRLTQMEVEGFQVKDVFRCILHTILFNREVGLVTPCETEVPFFDVTYVQCEDDEVIGHVERSADLFFRYLRHHKGRGTAVLTFYEKRKKSGWFNAILNKSPDKVPWEVWSLPIVVQSARAGDRERRHATCEETLRKNMMYIIDQVNKKKDHIPPLSDKHRGDSPLVYDFQINWQQLDDENWGAADYMKQVMASPPG